MTQGAGILDRAELLGREPMQSQATRDATSSGRHAPRRRTKGVGRRARESFRARATLAAGAETNGRQPATRDGRRAGVTPHTGIAHLDATDGPSTGEGRVLESKRSTSMKKAEAT